MSKKDQMIFGIIEEFRCGRISRAEAALKLGVCERTIQRRAKKIREKGVAGIKHGNSNRSPHNKIDPQISEAFLNLYKDRYFDFNFYHAYEFITEHHHLKASYSSFRKWCRSAGLGKHKKRRSSKPRLARERVANEGFMLQMDGSPEKWNGKDTWSLVSMIDDATSDIPHAEFYPSETTWACMNVLRKVIEKRGVPEFILTDQAGWSTGSLKRRNFSQFVRACQELGIKVLAATSPESKGRIERSFRTSQDRLIPELRLRKITSMVDANRYLEQVYLPEWRLKRTTTVNGPSRYRQLSSSDKLQEIFCMKHERKINRDHTVVFKNICYLIDEPELGRIWKKAVSIHAYQDGSVSIFYGKRRLNTKIFVRPRIGARWKKVS